MAKTVSTKLATTNTLIKCSAELKMYDHDDNRTKQSKHLEMLDGFFDPDPMLDYLVAPDLDSGNLTGGYLRCELDGKRLLLITDFGAKQKLGKKQLKVLEQECRGQWSDGLGEGAFDKFSGITGFEVETLPSVVKTEQTSGRPFQPNANAKSKHKGLAKKWQKIAQENAPSHDTAVLIKCFQAIEKKRLSTLKKLLDSGKVDVNAICRARTSEFDEQTLLVHAAWRSKVDIVSALLDAGADPSLCDVTYAPLHIAYHPTLVKRLLVAGADPNVCTPTDNKTPLMQDRVVRHSESVKLLLAAKAKPNAKTKYSRSTPLSVAAEVSEKSVKLLLKAGAKVTRECFERAMFPLSDLSRTTEKDRVAIVQMFLKTGAKIDTKLLIIAVETEIEPLVRIFLKAKVPINKLGEYCYFEKLRPSPLTQAISNGNTKLVKLLLSCGADPNLGKGTDHPLHVAMSAGSLTHVKLLIAAGVKLKPVLKGKSLEKTAMDLGCKDIAAFFAKLLVDETPKRQVTSKTVRKKSKVKASTKKKATKKKTAGRTKKGARMFEFSDGKSNKFWEIAIAGSKFTVHYGRIGATGQKTIKSLETPVKCQAAADKLIQQKMSKGYEEV